MVTTKIKVEDLNIWFEDIQPLKNITLDIHNNEILSIIGPSNSGKTTFLRALNRLNDLEDWIKMKGRILYDGKDIMRHMSPEEFIKKVGIIFALHIQLHVYI